MKPTSCAILVLNFNGRDLLEKCLGSVVRAVANSRCDACRVIVVDNGSTDGSVDWVRRTHASVEVIVARKNDFLFSLNPVVASLKEVYVAVLNNDMWVTQDFLCPVWRHFDDPDLFAVTCGIRDWDGVAFSAASRPPICTVRSRGSWYEEHYTPAPDIPTEIQLASGGASIYRRDRFVDLGGFDPLYRPGYSEDLDLSIRASFRGWTVVYEPDSVVHHLGSVSMKRAYGSKIKRIALRNRMLMVAKLFGNRRQNAAFILLYAKRCFQQIYWGNRDLGMAMCMAIPLIPRALIQRRRLEGNNAATTKRHRKVV